jgi:hypothetical protein
VRFQTHQIGSYAARNEPSKLVFNKYGDKYFLSSVWMPGRGVGNALPTSKTESETALRAALAPTSQVVLFARR